LDKYIGYYFGISILGIILILLGCLDILNSWNVVLIKVIFTNSMTQI